MYSLLLTKYIENIGKKIPKANLPKAHRDDIECSIDLLRAIRSYREFQDKDELLVVYPDLSRQSHYLELLWNSFDNHSPDEMYNLTHKILDDISKYLGSLEE